jgi:hypothetical protein
MNIQELKMKLQDMGVPREWYHLENHGNDDQRLCIVEENDRWLVYYSERGSRFRIAEFDNEDDACGELLNRIIKTLDYEKRHKRT